MANQQLYGKSYQIPSDVLNGINAALVSNPTGKGVKRAKFLLKNGVITYQDMKRIKNYFDYFNPQTDDPNEFALNGGEAMKTFIDTTLNQERKGAETSKEVRHDMTNNVNQELKPLQVNRHDNDVMNEADKKKELDKNAVAVIMNKDNKVLLLKRVDVPEIWQPNKWALVGGGIEKGESAEEAVKREIEEETGLEVDKCVESFQINRHGDSEETLFACRYNGEDTDVELDTHENTSYGWYDVNEMDYLETVPHLIEYITLVFKKYD